jgi:uncharacterized protein (TIGR02145 family)
MVENLKTTRYRNGDTIPYFSDNTQWQNSETGAFCDYNNTPSNSSTYGRLYNWYAIFNPQLCPEGWHVPFQSDWETLIDYMGGEAIAGGKLKEAGMSHWLAPNTGSNNSSGFTGLPGGCRTYGKFKDLGYRGYWWTFNIYYGSTDGIFWSLYYNNALINQGSSYRNSCFSVRCVKYK